MTKKKSPWRHCPGMDYMVFDIGVDARVVVRRAETRDGMYIGSTKRENSPREGLHTIQFSTKYDPSPTVDLKTWFPTPLLAQRFAERVKTFLDEFLKEHGLDPTDKIKPESKRNGSSRHTRALSKRSRSNSPRNAV